MGMEMIVPSYTVKEGDTLSDIALRFYGRADFYHALAKVNGIENPDVIRVGERILLVELMGP